MAMKDAEFIEKCIPDSLRLAEHQDAALVNEAIATTLMAYRKALRDNVWEKNIAADINRAMTAYMEGTYVPHISKENEDWSKLQLEAEEARVMKASQAEAAKANKPDRKKVEVTLVKDETDVKSYRFRNYDDSVSGGIACFMVGSGNKWACQMTFITGEDTLMTTAPTADEGVKQLVAKAGLVAKAAQAEAAETSKPKPEPETVYYQVGRTSTWRVSKGYLTVEEIDGNYVAKYETGEAEFTGSSPMSGDLNAARRSAADQAIRRAGFDPFAVMPKEVVGDTPQDRPSLESILSEPMGHD